MVVSPDLWVRVQCREGLRSAGVRGTRKRGMGTETGCRGARNSQLIVWHFSGDRESGLFSQVDHRHSGYIAAQFHSLRTTKGKIYST